MIPGERIFGPVPSRRLGRSLGINHIPAKHCTYSCVYCQLGCTPSSEMQRREFFPPAEIITAVGLRVEKARNRGERIDYLCFVPDGEPTLDIRLEEILMGLKPLGIPLAVISNSSLIWNPDVRRALDAADWVSLKMDALHKPAWRAVNRPHGMLDLKKILNGALAFAAEFSGHLVTETMLVAGENDSPADLRALSTFLQQLRPRTAYLAVPIRPPAESSVRAPDAAAVTRAFQILSVGLERVETLTGYEGNAFAASGNAEADLLSITAVHPMRRDAVEDLLDRCEASREVLENLVNSGRLLCTRFDGHDFYLRNFQSPENFS